jgi:hypothetical protein
MVPINEIYSHHHTATQTKNNSISLSFQFSSLYFLAHFLFQRHDRSTLQQESTTFFQPIINNPTPCISQPPPFSPSSPSPPPFSQGPSAYVTAAMIPTRTSTSFLRPINMMTGRSARAKSRRANSQISKLRPTMAGVW